MSTRAFQHGCLLGIVLLLTTMAARGALGAEPLQADQPPKGCPEYLAPPRADDGRDLALTVEKLDRGFDLHRPFLIWALGSSYTNFLGDGSQLIGMIRERFPDAPEIIYKKMVGNSVPYQYLRGWARHLVVPDQPDLVLVYTNGKAEDLEELIVEIQRQTTADIIVPTLHWRLREQNVWGQPDAASDQDPAALRELRRKYRVEFVENRREWGQYLAENHLPIEALLRDSVHQSLYGAKIINMNIARHIQRPDHFNYDPRSRERRLQAGASDKVKTEPGDWIAAADADGLTSARRASSMTVEFTGNRIDLVGWRSVDGGTAEVRIDGRPGNEVAAYYMTYVEPDRNNARLTRSPPRDCSPHGVSLGQNVLPQTWTITLTSDKGDYEVVGSVTGPDGRGNSSRPFTSESGQVVIEPELWRRGENNRAGDRFTFEVYRSAAAEVSFHGQMREKFCTRLAANLSNEPHRLDLVARGDGPVTVEAFDVFQPPLCVADRPSPTAAR